MVIDACSIHLDWLWSRKLLWLMTNGCKGIRRGNQMSSLYFAAQVETKANCSHPFCEFPLLDSTWSCLALPGKEKSLPQQKASQDLCYQPTNHKEGKRVFFFLRSRPKTGLLPHYFWPLHNLHTDVPGSSWSSRTWNWKENFEQLPSSHKNNTPTLANYYVFLETLCCPRPISKFLLSTDGMRRRKGYIPFLLLNFSERGREKSLRSDI